MTDTLYKVLHDSAARFGDHIALSQYQGEDISYLEVENRVAMVSQVLASAGLQPGDRVAILSSNTANWGVGYFAITTSGYIAVPILPDFTPDEVDHIISHSESKALFVSDRLYSKVHRQTLDAMNIVVRTKNLAVLMQNVHEQGSSRIPEPDDVAEIIYTSGTTSQPKGVMLTHRNLTSQIDMIAPVFMCRDDDVLLSVLPLSHTYECTIAFMYTFAQGSHMVYLDKAPSVSVLASALRDVRPTLMTVVPLLIEKIFRQKVQKPMMSTAFKRWVYGIRPFRILIHRIAGRRLMRFFGGRIRFFGIGGAKLDAITEQFLLEARIPYAIGYGLTETSPLLAAAIGSDVRLGSTGFFLKGIEYRLENVDPATGQGEIVVKSPSQMIGYYKNDEATREAISADGFFHTGDLGFIDEDGRLYIKGRLKNMIVGSNGENIYPEDIESVLNAHVFISESVVTEQDGHLVALVQLDREALEAAYEELKSTFEAAKQEWSQVVDRTLSEIKEYVNSGVNRNSKIDEVIEQKEDFVKTPTKKIRRFLYTRN